MLDKTERKKRLAADIGGTFTDVAAFDERSGELRLGKVLSQPHDLVGGITNGIGATGVDISDTNLFFHGSTIAINTLLERKGARTALLTTAGFRDIYEIGRINRPDSFNLYFRKHLPLIERQFRLEVNERLYADGSVCRKLDMDEIAAIADRLEQMEIEAVAILFLHSYRNPEHEIKVRDYLKDRLPQVFITASHELSQEYREFERTSTVAANAYVGPKVNHYMGQLDSHLSQGDFPGSLLIVKSSGGLYSAPEARTHCIWMLESGPAAGVVGAKELCEVIGLKDAIAFDMGGTTAKAGVIKDGQPLTTSNVMVGGYREGLPIQMTMIDIHEVGTGGGSIAKVGPGGSVRVGPESAGADPGPACYALGGSKPTVTDANLILGRLAPDRFLGGNMRLDPEAARKALVENLCSPLGLELKEAAAGILKIAVNAMSHSVKGVTSERGLDPGAFDVLIAYGGAGPLHASAVARELGIRRVLIPAAPGHFAATGMLRTDLRHDFTRSIFKQLDDLPFKVMIGHYEEMEGEARQLIEDTGISVSSIVMQRGIDMRYVEQEHAATVELPDEVLKRFDIAEIRRLFDEKHLHLYGHASPEKPVEMVSLRSSVRGVLPKPNAERTERSGQTSLDQAFTGARDVCFDVSEGYVETPTYARDQLQAGNTISGPALVEEYASTTVVFPGDTLEVDELGNLLINTRKA
ncbi:hydantoinase/oxoprolinase family protein [Hoeflea sp. WL0058]|uniref:Hydantoinase/oxoprolinase family protein n=1 Tax=Flavimaribacter sediminis TaxID=2865987 RepID=A0AAE3D1F4_9HYPH|nr:hydantoinase/oxoprolinase family protein [Flavimaribacter sediminis]